jgi:hypothetical protein
MRTQRIVVTPEKALEWLENDKDVHHNRPLKQHKVNQYAKDMKEGRWLENHQGIAFGADGEILDGQHRLWAVAEAKIPIPFLVTFNMSQEAQRTVDDHIKRSVVDVLTVETGGTSGIVENLHASIANRMMHGNRHLQVPTRQETVAYLTKHFEAIDFAIAGVGRKKVRGVTRAPVLAPVARAFYKHDHQRLYQWLGVLVSGDVEDKIKDQPAKIFREFLIRNVAQRSPLRAELVYSKAERSLYAFLHGQQLHKLYEAADELFPIESDNKRIATPTSSSTRRIKRIAEQNRGE